MHDADVVLLPSAGDERGRATMDRCAKILLMLIMVDLRELGEQPKPYLVEHQEVHDDGKTDQRLYSYLDSQRQRTRR